MTPLSILKRCCGAAALVLFLAGAAQAQDVDATQMIRGGLEVIRMVDTGNTGELWDSAAPGAKKRVTRPEFIRQIAQARAALGAPQARAWVAVRRQVLTNADPDLAGQVVTMEYETRFANRAQAVSREQVTFYLDRDGTWRLLGYFVN